MSAALRKGWCPGALRPMAARDGLIVRLRITGGILPAATARTLADLAEGCGNGLLDLSARGNLQLRGVRDATLQPLQDRLQALGLLDANAAAESVRNVIASPLAGLTRAPDIRPLTQALEARLAADATLHALPGKFGFLLDGGGMPSLAGVAADVRFDGIDAHFSIGLGGTRTDALWIGTCEAGDLVARAVHVARGFLTLASRLPEARRMRDVIAAFGAEAVAAGCGGGSLDAPAWVAPPLASSIVGLRTLEEAHRRPAPAQGQPHHRVASWLGLAAPFGRLDASMLRAAADVAATALGELRLTPWRTILVPAAPRRADLAGFITDPDDRRLAVAACVGMDGCARGTTATQADATTLAEALPRAAGIQLHVSGCEKGCAKPSRTALTLVARDGLYDLVRDGRAGDPPVARRLHRAAVRDAVAAALQPA